MTVRTTANILMIIVVLLSLCYAYLLDEVEHKALAQTQQNDNCKIYNDKAKELAEKGAEDLPERQTLNFDPRIAKSKASIAYSQIYRNCKKWGE